MLYSELWHYFGLSYRLKLKENIIYLSFQPLNDPTDAVQLLWLKVLTNSWAFSRRKGSLIGMLSPRIDVNHFSKASFNFSYVPVFTLCRFSDEFWKASKIFFFVFLPSRKSTARKTDLARNIFIRPTLFKFLLWNYPNACFLWPFLLCQPPTIESKQIWKFQNIQILWHSN